MLNDNKVDDLEVMNYVEKAVFNKFKLNQDFNRKIITEYEVS
jgi:hypothetical protein